MQKKFSLLRLLFVFCITCIFYTLTLAWLGPELAIFTLPLALLFLQWCHLAIEQRWRAMRSLSHARVELNLNASGLPHTPYRFKNKLSIALLVLAFVAGFYISFKDPFLKWSSAALRYLMPTQAILSVEPPSYAQTTQKEYLLSKKNTIVALNTESYLKLRLENASGTWALSLTSDAKKQFTAQLNARGLWSMASQTLYSQLQSSNERTSLPVQLTLSDGKKTFYATLTLNPSPKPVVTLEQVPTQLKVPSDPSEKIAFAARAQSRVPLSVVELAVRTQSGYQFKKTLGEFANGRQEEFQLNYTELITAGIPFQGEDILYVKAVAHTVLAELVGESQELSFPIRTPMQVRGEVIQKLERALANLKKGSSKEPILNDLAESKRLLNSMIRYGSMQKSLEKAIEHTMARQSKQDVHTRRAQSEIEKVLSLLKRQQKDSELGNFLYSLQNFNAQLSKQTSLTDKEIYLKQAQELAKAAQNVKNGLSAAAKQSKGILDPSEQQLVQSLLQNDQTAQHLTQTETALAQNNLPIARAQSQMGLDSAIKNLSGSAQILLQARLRAMAKAKKHLNTANQLLEQSIQESDAKTMDAFLKEAKEHLQQTPVLNEEMQAATLNAQKNTEASQQAIRQKKWDQQLKGAQQAQNDIERALLALEEEEKNQEQTQNEQEARSSQSAMDILSAQGQLDSSWRKKILEEIAALKKQGMPSDAPLIQYLESRLR